MDYHFQKRKQILSISGSNRCYTWRLCVCVRKEKCHLSYSVFLSHTHTQLRCCFCSDLFFQPFVLICIKIQVRFESVSLQHWRTLFPHAHTHTFYAVCMLLPNIYFTRIYLIMFLCCIYCQMQCHFGQFLWFWQVPNSASVFWFQETLYFPFSGE